MTTGGAMTSGVRALAGAHRCGDRDPRDTIEQVIEALRVTQDRFIWINRVPDEQLRARATELAAGRRDLPLLGVPFAVKDNIDVAGLPTTAGCPDFAHVPAQTAFVVRCLLAAGAILVGKTNMDQFATGLAGTRTPYGACASVVSPQHVSGGSSSGSAVAVGAGVVAFALGTDTAGSGRVPAAFNAIVGLKPTIGRLSTHGVLPACRTLDCVTIFARDAGDAAAVLAVAGRFDQADPFSRQVPSPTPRGRPSVIGVPRDADLGELDAPGRRAWRAARARIAGLADDLVEIEIEPFVEAARLLYDGPWVAERYVAVGEFLERDDIVADPTVRAIVLAGAKLSATDAFRGLHRLAELRLATNSVWERIDALALPTVPSQPTHAEVAADPVGVNARLGLWTNFVNLLDLAAVAVPAEARDDGRPFGVTFTAPAWSDESLLRLAVAFERTATTQVDVAVVGAHLSGMARNHELVEHGARRVRCARTAPCYRLFDLADGTGRPGLIRDPDGHGAEVEIEIWRLGAAAFGSFVAAVRAPLAIGSLELADGTTVHGFLCEAHAVRDAREVTQYGGWREYLATASSGSPA
ncbi:MAG: allophanate hydrolase [Solirubrobacteraceae bacterium]|nr:allophanate hydrolase [Solirubrobacteraceae bacterium]